MSDMTSSSLEITVAARRRDPIPFHLMNPDGSKDYYTSFVPPKAGMMVRPYLITTLGPSAASSIDSLQASVEYLKEGLSTEEWERLDARVADLEDDLDYDTLDLLVARLMEAANARPTT